MILNQLFRLQSDDRFILPLENSTYRIEELRNLLMHKNVNKSNKKVSSQKYDRPKIANQIISQAKAVMRYEDDGLQRKVRRLVPLEQLQVKAIEQLRNIQRFASLLFYNQSNLSL